MGGGGGGGGSSLFGWQLTWAERLQSAMYALLTAPLLPIFKLVSVVQVCLCWLAVWVVRYVEVWVVVGRVGGYCSCR
jgi:hypothetical protein